MKKYINSDGELTSKELLARAFSYFKQQINTLKELVKLELSKRQSLLISYEEIKRKNDELLLRIKQYEEEITFLKTNQENGILPGGFKQTNNLSLDHIINQKAQETKDSKKIGFLMKIVADNKKLREDIQNNG